MKCADFSKCSVASWSTVEMNSVKEVFAVLLTVCLIATVILYHSYSYMHMFFYYSYWGAIMALLSTMLQVWASAEPEKYQTAAVICSEMAWSFNLMIFPLFWLLIAPIELPKLNWHVRYDAICGVHYFTTHTWPIISCIVNTYLTKDMTLIREDKWIMLAVGIVYVFANYIGTIVEGAPLYPIADWKNTEQTILLYIVLAVAQTFAYSQFTQWLNQKRGPWKASTNKMQPAAIQDFAI